jgi:glycosyltransferase involved in cell wall biosynthesis
MDPDVESVPRDPLVCFFGMVYPGKGLDLILDVLQEVRKRHRPLLFKFIGGTKQDKEGYESELRSRIKERNLDGIAEHLGLLLDEEVSGWFRKSRFVFLPYEGGVSDRRGSLMAALAHGKAVLTSRPAVGMPFLQNGVNVLWPEEPSVSGYASAFLKLLTDGDLVVSLQKAAFRLSRQFRWERIAQEHEWVLSRGSTARC